MLFSHYCYGFYYCTVTVAADESCAACETTLRRRSLTYRKFCKRDFGETMPLVFLINSSFC